MNEMKEITQHSAQKTYSDLHHERKPLHATVLFMSDPSFYLYFLNKASSFCLILHTSQLTRRGFWNVPIIKAVFNLK